MLPADDGGAGNRSTAMRRYGPLAVIVVLLVVVAAVVLVGGGGGDDDDGGTAAKASGDLDWVSVKGVEPGAPAPTGKMPVTYDEAKDAGDVDDLTWPDTCDTDKGRIKLPSVYALPCVPEFKGDNGGETSPGVTADTIKVVIYGAEQGSDLTAILGAMGANDTPEQREDTLNQYVDLYTSVSETYGRKIEIVPFAASGLPTDVVAAKADATDILATKPFAVVGGPALDRGTFAQTLAAGGVICFDCAGAALPQELVLKMAPYVWGTLPVPDQILDLLATWVNALGDEGAAGSAAEMAGGDLKGKPRKIGVIHFEQDPPVFKDLEKERADIAEVALTETYVLDFPTLPAKAAEIIAKFKSEGITTITFLGDPFMPIYLTQAATEADYFPEWIFTGTALTDTNAMARQYDQEQMARAGGISELAAPTDQDLQEFVRLYRWYYGGAADALPPAKNQYAVVAPSAAWLAAGIHMAGPDLTPQTFARGLFRLPPGGGGATTPRISYGNWGVSKEAVDYFGIDDAVEIWWDPQVQAEDERGQMGKGAWRRSDEGKRFLSTDSPTPALFDEDGSITVVDKLTGGDEPPDYPPPEGSPAAGG
jgi:hypothetical protein